MRAPLLALTLVLALAGAAAAGSAESPEIADPEGDAGMPGNELADILRAWLEDDAGELRVTLEVAKLQRPPAGTGWVVLFDLAGKTLWVGAYADLTDAGPIMFPSWGEWDRARNIPLTFTATDGSVTEGTPGTVAVQVTKDALVGAVGSIPADAVLTSLAASGGNGMQVSLMGTAIPQEPVYREWDAATGVDFPLTARAFAPVPAGANGTANLTTAQETPEEPRTVPLPALAALLAALAATRRR